MKAAFAIRWTVGEVSAHGFDALRLSILGAAGAFGPDTPLAVVVNSIAPKEARRRVGQLDCDVEWLSAQEVPACLAPFLDREMAEGVAWKFRPLRLFPERFEIALDNDCILWRIPPTIAAWREEIPARCLIAADVKPAFGAFASITGPEPRNTGIRGFPPGYDLGSSLAAVLREHPIPLRSELDEQGLEAAALDRGHKAVIVPTREVTICSPFWPHEPRLGSSGAHFVGLNAHNLPWRWYDRPATDCVVENYAALKPEICRRIDAACRTGGLCGKAVPEIGEAAGLRGG